MKSSLRFFRILVALTIILMFVSCPQANTEKPASEPTVEDIAIKAVEEIFKELNIQTASYSKAYETKWMYEGAFRYGRLYANEDNTKIVYADSRHVDWKFLHIVNNKINELEYGNNPYEQYFWESTNTILKKEDYTIVYDNNNPFDHSDYILYEETKVQKSIDAQIDVTYETYEMEKWDDITESESKNKILLKETDTEFIIVNLNEDINNSKNLKFSKESIYKKEAKSPLSYIPSTSVVKDMIEEYLSTKNVNVNSYDEFYFLENIVGSEGINGGIIVPFNFIYLKDDSMVNGHLFIKNGEFESIEEGGTVLKENIYNELRDNSVEILQIKKQPENLIYEGEILDLNGYAHYTYEEQGNTKNILIKKSENKLYLADFYLNDDGTAKQMEGILLVLDKQ